MGEEFNRPGKVKASRGEAPHGNAPHGYADTNRLEGIYRDTARGLSALNVFKT